jgi:ribosomal protein L33
MSQQTLKELLKPPFTLDQDAVGDIFITDKSKRFVLKMPALKVDKEMADFANAALNEKAEREFGERKRWVRAKNKVDWLCRNCGIDFYLRGTSNEYTPDKLYYQYCPHCGMRLDPPEEA